ncbi:uncharacterized protein LOC108703782 [Xenopus laevis]|uniref:Transmembrane protein 248 n=1 Tax=Xenopus laevis TaxID=8355 RepID=A0A8J0TVH2_XENLA|nr:uncharacterized protein LOC108703782 [Xenopus laevis]OCT58970.1 hypothetical protein XELAEV_18001459mg [Xenopus laevis]
MTTICVALRTCVRHNPPVVCFFVCLASLAITLLSLSLLIMQRSDTKAGSPYDDYGDTTAPVPDTHSMDMLLDWEALLYGISSRIVCPMATVTGVTTSPAEHSGNISTVTTLVRLNVTPFDPSILDSAILISVTGAKLGLTGKGANTNMSIAILPISGRETCNDTTSCLSKYCVSISGPKSMLPQTKSVHCPMTDTKPQLLAEMKVMDQDALLPSTCYRMVYNSSSAMNMTVFQVDRSLCKRHVMYSLFFVVGSFITLLIVVLIWAPTGHNMKPKELL